MNTVTDNTSLNRFELLENGKLAFSNYTLEAGIITLPHVEAHPDLRGKGTAARLMQGTLEAIAKRHLKVRPTCRYAIAYIQKHPEFHKLLA